jgi:hypothetical protein
MILLYRHTVEVGAKDTVRQRPRVTSLLCSSFLFYNLMTIISMMLHRNNRGQSVLVQVLIKGFISTLKTEKIRLQNTTLSRSIATRRRSILFIPSTFWRVGGSF